MMWVKNRFQEFDQRIIAIDQHQELTYADFLEKVKQWRKAIRNWNIVSGDRVALVSECHIDVIALLQALVENGCIVIPLSKENANLFDVRLSTACASKVLTVASHDKVNPATTECVDLGATSAVHPLLEPLVSSGQPGFVIFTSGSTGKEKAVLLDYGRMTKKYRGTIRASFRTLLFLKLDHIGGLNTLLSIMFNGGTIVTCPSRKAKDICSCIEKYAVELLPTTPSFLTMLLMSGLHQNYDLSSLKVITYGTEVMPESTLASLHRTFPGVVLKQTYGLSELGILSTKSKDSSSKWMKIGGEGMELKVKNDTLWIKSEQAMLGYLNAPSPFDEDGWYNTGDKVVVDGDYFQILGRESEIINVGGEKVFPSEVESFLLTLENVKDVIVRGKKNPLMGQVVWAEFLLEHEEDTVSFKKRVVEQCQRQLSPFKVPGLITVAGRDSLVGPRFKKIRRDKQPTTIDAPSADMISA
jgi:acyl-CoA synthetase (AMP-forming)/AMP-acid ligase II